MSKKVSIDDFLQQKTLAVAGVSRSKHKFGRRIYQDLIAKGYKTYALNPNAESVDDIPCHPGLKSLPEKVDGVVAVVPPEQTEKLVRDAKEAGVTRVWMQQGSESPEAVDFCQKNGISVITGECILMFAPPVRGVHGFHRLLWKWFGKLPV